MGGHLLADAANMSTGLPPWADFGVYGLLGFLAWYAMKAVRDAVERLTAAMSAQTKELKDAIADQGRDNAKLMRQFLFGLSSGQAGSGAIHPRRHDDDTDIGSEHL
jgi:citrate lyase beta subunit